MTSPKSIVDRLSVLSTQLEGQIDLALKSDVVDPVKKLGEAVDQVKKSFSGSWIGYHANVYYHNFQVPPSGHRFSPEWGLRETLGGYGTTGDWESYTFEDVDKHVQELAGNPDISPAADLQPVSRDLFEDTRFQLLTIIEGETKSNDPTSQLYKIKQQIESFEVLTANQFVNRKKPREVQSRDSEAMHQGLRAPPHVQMEGRFLELHNSTAVLIELNKLIKRLITYFKASESSSMSDPQNTSKAIDTNTILSTELLHPFIVEHGYSKYLNGDLRNAVLDSMVAVFEYIRQKTGFKTDGKDLVQEVFSLSRPKLILSDLDTESGKSDQKGFIELLNGAYQGIRNPKSHSLLHDLTEIKAMQYMVFASLLVRRIEESTVVTTDQRT